MTEVKKKTSRVTFIYIASALFSADCLKVALLSNRILLNTEKCLERESETTGSLVRAIHYEHWMATLYTVLKRVERKA